MPHNVKRGFMAMILPDGTQIEECDRMAQHSWGLLSDKAKHSILQQLGSNAMVAGLVRDATDEFRRLFDQGMVVQS